jgi:hypothetical protein
MALEGSLRDFDLFSLFNMIKTQGKSGTLVLSRGQEFVKIFFDQGEIVGCDSNQVRVEDRIGAMLVRLGRLSGEELLAMVQRQRQTMKRLGTLLLESGKVAAEDLQDALFNQAMSIIYRTFRWVEGDYRFDSILPLDLDRENFPPIPVDTILMEAARIMDEWPEVQKRLPDNRLPLKKTPLAHALVLDIDRDLARVFDGETQAHAEGSGLSHEQETVLTYFSEPSSVQNVLQISRYDELDTCKLIAELLEMGLLEVSDEEQEHRVPVWNLPREQEARAETQGAPSLLLWPAVAVLLGLGVAFPPPWSRPAFRPGLTALRPAAAREADDPVSRERLAWAYRMASPRDGGTALARTLGSPEPEAGSTIPDLGARPDPLPEAAAK